MSASQRRKGHDFERQVAAALRAACPGFEVRRGMQSRSGSDEPDVIAPSPFWIEAKRGRRTSHRAALKQATQAAPEGYWPTAICRDDRSPGIVSMQLDDWLELVAQWWALNQGRVG